MATLIRLSEHRAVPRRVSFTRAELNRLLSIYSRRVINGEWRDYALDHEPGMAVFSVFRSSLEPPLYAVVKRGPGQNCEFLLFSGREKLRHGASLDDVVASLDRRLELVAD